MTKKIPFLFQRNGMLVFRRRVPPRHHALAGVSEWKISLGRPGSEQSGSLIEVRLLTEATDKAIILLDRGIAPPRTLLDDTLNSLYPSRIAAKVPSISDAARLFEKERRLPELKKPEAMAVKQFVAFAGDMPIDNITRSQVRDWISSLRELSGQSDATIRRRLGSLSSIYNNAAEAEVVSADNPFARHRLNGADAGYRLPFEKDHLRMIDQWLCSAAGMRPTGSIIGLLRTTGARPLEIGGLEAADIRLDAPIPHIVIAPNQTRRLKTASSQRLIPLVGNGLEISGRILDTRSNGPVFPPTCWQTGTLSARLNKALRSTGIPRTRQLTAYSFRHTMAETLRTTDAPFDVQQAILGHAKTTVTERYGARTVSLARMQEAMKRALNIAHI